jgi:glucose/arabinose dehydrogenase
MLGVVIAAACAPAEPGDTEGVEAANGGVGTVAPDEPDEIPSDELSSGNGEAADPGCVPAAWADLGDMDSIDSVATVADLCVEVQLTEVARLDSAIAGAVGPDGVLYLADRSGLVYPLRDGVLGDAVVDLSDETTTDAERGLLGIAFAADCSELYLSFTDMDGTSRLDAVSVVDGVVDASQRRQVLVVDQPYANHNGGDVQIGPDGLLYLGLGDGGGAGDPLDAGQDLASLLGAMLRIDPQGEDPYAIPQDNPFVGVQGAADEIWAYGLRNPWRFSFDRVTGDLWIADVGQNAREEINLLSVDDVGVNLGWNRMEGTLPFAGTEPSDHHPPIHEYATTSSRCAITGGYVYRGSAIAGLEGAYLFSDYCEGRLRALSIENGQVTAAGDLGVEGGRVVSFAQDATGELYMLALDGAVYRIDPA